MKYLTCNLIADWRGLEPETFGHKTLSFHNKQ